MKEDDMRAAFARLANTYEKTADLFGVDAKRYEDSQGDREARWLATGWARGMAQAYAQVSDDLRKLADL